MADAAGDRSPAAGVAAEPAGAVDPRVSDVIRDAIIRGDYVPNQRLVEADLSAAFSASRATVRTALLQLAGEGLVERLPNRGSRVRAISVDEAIEILEVRMAVEGLCAAKTAASISGPDIAAFQRLRARMVESVAEGDLVEYSRLNQYLDVRIRELSHHATASGVLARLHAQSVRHQFKLSSRPQRAKVSVLEHAAIIDAVVARNPEAAEQAVRSHLLSVIEALREVSAAEPGTPAAG